MEQNNTQDVIKLKPEIVKLKLPSIYKVIILNDDFTPMEFVSNVIQKIFRKSSDEAT